MKKFLSQSCILLSACAIAFFWDKSPYTSLTISLLIILIAGFFITSFLWKEYKKSNLTTIFENKESMVIFFLITILLLVILGTGKFASPLFFLLYFATFGIVFVFHPATVFVFVFGIVTIFLPDIITNSITEHIIKTACIVLISPFAFFFGKEHIKETDIEKNKQ